MTDPTGVERDAVVGGVLTRWWEHGPVDAAWTILAVHGFRGDHHGLARLVELLPRHRVISPDLPGFGESAPFAHGHDVTAYADWLVEFAAATATGHRPYLVLGHSFGTIVVAAALDRGLDPDAIALVNPIATPAMRGPKAIGAAVTLGWYRAAQALPERAGTGLLSARPIVDLMSLLTTTTRDRALRRWIRDEHRRRFSGFASRDSVVEGFDASISDFVGAHVGAFCAPTLLVAAADDQITSLEDVEALQRTIPGSVLQVIDRVGHLIHYERPAEAAVAVEAFLADLPRS